MQRYEKKIALVTGAAQGVGRAVARRLAAEGASVVLVDREAKLCESALAEIAAAGGRASACGADLATHAGAAAMVAHALALHGRIDVSVHNVGGTIWAKPFWEYKPEEIEAEIARSFWPAIWSCHAVVPVMRAQGAGAIVNIGSAATRWTLRVPYSASKGAVNALTVTLARELAQSGVRVNCVAPGALDVTDRVTPRNTNPVTEADRVWRTAAVAESVGDTPMKRAGTVDEVAAAVCFLASDEASYVTGEVMHVAGGAG
jgi:dihydroxycyclohexadiene carboxylate dehydrogenase